MSLSAQEITRRLLSLPEQEQQEALDFIEFLQTKSARKLSPIKKRKGALPGTPDTPPPTPNDDQAVSAIYQAFEQAGLIGCIETDEQLSTTYKEKLDFSFKHGVTG